MNVADFIDPHNVEHMKVFKSLHDGKNWPKGFLPKGIEFPTGWFIRVMSRICDAWIEEKTGSVEDDCSLKFAVSGYITDSDIDEETGKRIIKSLDVKSYDIVHNNQEGPE